MTYQAKRTLGYTQELELVDEFGRVVHSIKVALDPGSMAEKLSRQYVDILRAQERVSKMQIDPTKYGGLKDVYNELGETIITIMKSVFGEEDTAIILEFYRNRYNDIVLEVLPFIANVVIPDIRRISQQNKKEIQQKYNRKQRRAILKAGKKRWGI